MPYARLMACLEFDRPNDRVLAVARDLAKRLNARVVGMAAKQASAHVGQLGPSEPHEHDLHKFKARARQAEDEFRAIFPDSEAHPWRARLTFGPASEFVAGEARAADLVIASTARHESLLFSTGQPDAGDLLMRLGRPLLGVPNGVTGLKLAHALVCWKDGREARRAVADALPLLSAAGRVDVVELADARHIEEARARLAEIGAWLGGHGVEAQCLVEMLRGSESAQLAGVARELGADLLVAGAFGHSRLREWAFGGVTRELVLGAERCVLASH